MKRTCVIILGLLFLSAVCRLTVRVRSAHPAPAAVAVPSRPNTPFERTLRQAWKLRSRALLAEVSEREALECWDPSAAGSSSEALRRRDLAGDPSGDLRRARHVARVAAGLAWTPGEARRAAMLLFLIERDLRPAGVAGLVPAPNSHPGRAASGPPIPPPTPSAPGNR